MLVYNETDQKFKDLINEYNRLYEHFSSKMLIGVTDNLFKLFTKFKQLLINIISYAKENLPNWFTENKSNIIDNINFIRDKVQKHFKFYDNSQSEYEIDMNLNSQYELLTQTKVDESKGHSKVKDVPMISLIPKTIDYFDKKVALSISETDKKWAASINHTLNKLMASPIDIRRDLMALKNQSFNEEELDLYKDLCNFSNQYFYDVNCFNSEEQELNDLPQKNVLCNNKYPVIEKSKSVDIISNIKNDSTNIRP